MRFLISGSIAFAAIIAAGAVNAADLPLPYKAAPVSPAYSWQGFYIGANGGFSWGSSCWTFVDTVPPGLGGPSAAEGCHDPSGGIVGGQVGYDWQLSNWVLGLEAQGDWASLRGQNVSAAFPTTTNRTRVDGLGLFTGRIGYTWSSALFYAKGGAALVQNDYDFFGTLFGAPVTGGASQTRWGGTGGGGIEYKFTPNWSLAVEYDYVALGTSRLNFTTSLGVNTLEDINQSMNLVTARINYSFP